MPGPLSGMRVIDVTMWAFCPSAAAVLASWGADVVHVENPHSPDPMRLFAGGSTDPGGAHWFFKHYNRGKRSIAIDLSQPEGQAVLHRLVADADVFLTSFLERTRKKLHFDVEDLRAVNPSIVYAKGSGAGPLGPEASRGGYDGATWWNRGSLAASTAAVTGVDWPPGMVGHGDGMSGLVFAGGISAALLQRERTGEAAVVDSSLLGTAMWFNGPAITSSGFPPEQRLFQSKTPRTALQWTSNTYATKDGRFVMLSMLGDHQDEFVDFCEHIGRRDLVDDPRFATTADRMSNSTDLVTLLDDVFAARTYEQWKQALVTMRGVWAPVQTPAEMREDPQAVANSMIVDVEYPDGPLPLVSPPVMFDNVATPATRAPDFGEHTDDILDAAGFARNDVAELRRAGVVG